jgi:alpha-1,2-mannosyltransferase
MAGGARDGSPIAAARLPRWPGVAAVIAGGVAAAVAVVVAVRGGAPFGIDLAVRELVVAQERAVIRLVATGLTLLGTGPVLYPVLLALCLIPVARVAAEAEVVTSGTPTGGPAPAALTSAARRSVQELLPVVVLAAGQVLELALFATLHRPAPAEPTSTLLTTTYSSGRTAAAVLGWGLIAWQVCRLRGHAADSTAILRPVWITALSFGLAVGATRVYLGVHWFSDWLGGVAIGSAMLAVALAVLVRSDPHRRDTVGPGAELVRRPPSAPHPSLASPSVSTPVGWPARLGLWFRDSPWAWSVPAMAALVPVVPVLLAPPDQRLKDMLVYHGAGGTAGAGENLYAFQTVFAMPFTYPPFAALVLEPIARMPLGIAQALWTIATLAAVVALAATVLRPVAVRIGLPLTVAASLVTIPVRSHIRFGQVGIFLVLLVTLDLLRRDRIRGWGLGLATAIKLTPAVFLPWLVVTRQWRRLCATLLWCGGATLLGLVLLWPSAGDYLFRAARDTSRFGINDIPGNQSVRGMLLRLLPDPAAERAWLVAAVVLVAIGTYQAWRCDRSGNRLAAVGVLAALSIAVSPISWVHHLVFLAVPVAALAVAGRLRLVAGWFVLLTISFPVLGSSLGAGAPSLRYLAELITDLPGLSAVATVLLLPWLTAARRPTEPATGDRAPSLVGR